MTAKTSTTVPWCSIADMLRDNCGHYAGQPALCDGNTRLTYSELKAHSDHCVRALHACGVGHGHRVCIWGQNTWHWVICATALWRLGAVVVPISSRLKAFDAFSILDKSAASLLITTADCGGLDLPGMLVDEFGEGEGVPIQGLPSLSAILCMDEQPSRAPSRAIAAVTPATEAPVEPRLYGDELAEILFTSGTTGEPKGVLLTHRQILQAYWDWSALGGLEQGDRFLVVPPFSHGFGINAGIVASIMRGMQHVVVGFFQPERVLDLVAFHSITVMSGAPALFGRLCEEAGGREGRSPLATVRVVYVGAAHVAPELIQTLQDVHGIRRVINAYGLIEGCVVSMTRDGDPVELVSSSVGRPLPGVEVDIRDEAGRPCQAGDRGEIWVRGYGVMQGYLDAPARTAEAITAEGWLKTGDAGMLDDAGYLRIVGRLKDMFITNGFNVYPAEIEDFLLQHPAVASVAVVGVHDSRRGEVGFVFAVPDRAASDSTLPHPLSWLRQRIASYKVPVQFEWIDSLPLNDNGKVRKDMLRQRAEQISLEQNGD